MELQAYRIYTRRDEGAWGYCPFAEPTDVELNDEQVYIKSEADRYIARQKYKRCLAKAKLCAKNVDHLNSEGYIYEKEGQAKELTDCIKGTEFYDKWYHRWLKLAEKFKEAQK